MKLPALAVIVLVVAARGSVAYACGDGGGGCGTGSGEPHHGSHQCAPNLAIEWKSPSGVQPSAAYVGCSLNLTSSTLAVSLSDLGPGDNCTFHAQLANTGKKSVALTESVSIGGGSACSQFGYADNLPSSPATDLAPGHAFAFRGTISLNASAGNACQGAFASVAVVITGAPSSSCDDNGPTSWAASGLSAGPTPLWDCD